VTYREALGFLDSLVDYEKQAKQRTAFKLDNIRRLLGQAGKPQQRLDNVVLVAGTKGKGSVCHMVESGLRASGIRTGMFLSPHVNTVRERIQLDGRLVSKAVFSRSLERLAPLVWSRSGQGHGVRRSRGHCGQVSYFEFTTAMAFELFARSRPDYSVVEVGLGGRLDATNLSEPAVSVITRIGLDHLGVLGNTVRKIAREKSGIMRAGRPVVVGQQVPAAAAELRRRAREAGASLVPVQERTRVWNVGFSSSGVDFSVLSEMGAGRISLPLWGRHQVENCSTALAVLGLLARTDSRIRFDRVAAGLAEVAVPARCQVVRHEPPVIVDSCHNPDSGRALADAIASHLGRKVVLVYGSLLGKLVSRTIAPLAPWVDRAVLVSPDSPRAEAPEKLRRAFSRIGVPCIVAGSVKNGLDVALQLSGREIPVVVAGSFYVAGEALACLHAARGD